MFDALGKTMKDLGPGEWEKGKHNSYVFVNGDSTEVYLIPGYLPGQFIFGGSYLYDFVGGELTGKKVFHFGYQYVKDAGKFIPVRIKSDMNRVPNECDIMKYLTLGRFISRLDVETTEYLFSLSTADGKFSYDVKKLIK